MLYAKYGVKGLALDLLASYLKGPKLKNMTLFLPGDK